MGYGIERDEAIALLKKYIKNENLIRHCLASEAVMIELAKRFGEDEEKWALAGLLHDLDVELVNADLSVHTLEAEKILKDKGVDDEIIEAIKMHNETASKKKRSNRFHHALAAAETITGLVVATALVYPDKKLASVRPKSIRKRMKEKAFAAGVNREIIMECEKIGLDISEFSEISLTAMREIADQLGL